MGKGVGRRRGEIEKKEKELMFKDNSVLIDCGGEEMWKRVWEGKW